MRTIIPNQTFKHDSETYVEGQEYKVPDDDAKYFEAAGWIGERVGEYDSHLLSIHDVQLGHSAEVN